MAQDLFYIAASSSLTLIKENEETYFWDNISNLEISGSAYDATISGSEFGGTAASIRIYAYSGSILVVSFPLEDTNLYYNPPPSISPSTPFETSSFSFLSWNFSITNYSSFSASQLSGSGASISNTVTSTNYFTLRGYDAETLNGTFNIISGDTHSFSVSGSGSTEIGLYINNETSGSIVFFQTASSGYISASYVPLAFNNYSVTFSIVGSPPLV